MGQFKVQACNLHGTMTEDSGHILRECLRTMVTPIVRFCLRYCIQVQDIIEIIKTTLVKVAQEELEKAGESPSNLSRIMASTGMHRRDVMRIARDKRVEEKPQGLVNRIIGQWQNDRRFCKKPGNPNILSFEGPNNDFKRLCQTISRDLKPGTVLFELERLGVVERTKQGLKLVSKVYVPRHDFKYGLFTLGRDTDDLITSVVENLFELNDAPNLHGKTEFDNISPQVEKAIRDFLLEEGTAFHTRIREFLSQFDRDINPTAGKGSGRLKVGVGAFSIIKRST